MKVCKLFGIIALAAVMGFGLTATLSVDADLLLDGTSLKPEWYEAITLTTVMD